MTEREDSWGVTVRSDLLALMAVAGVLWGGLYVLAGTPVTAIYPWAFSTLSLVNWWLHHRRGLTRALDAQLVISVVAPFLVMLHLGGLQSSGGVVLWALMPSIAALLTYGVRAARWWFAGYAGLLLVGVLAENRLEPWGEPLSAGWVTGFWFGNLLGVTLAAWLVIARDTVQRARLVETERQARLLAEDATRAKSEFLANMSHELRTPMNAVIGMNGLLASTELDPEQEEYVTAIRTSAEVLLTTINDVLDFSKMEAGRFEIDPRTTDLRALVESTLDVITPLASQKRIDLVYDVAQDVPRSITTDGHRLRQVLVNLLTNAVKFTETGEVALTVRCDTLDDGTGAIAFQVRDTGIGIPARALDSLFESFQQVDPSTSRRYGGTGLGLAISRNLTELLGGSISVTSTPGEGSCFTVCIPSRDAVAPASAELDPGAHLAGRVMLVVLDNPTDQHLLENFGRGWSMDVVCVESMREALEAVEHHRIDIVLIDHQRMRGDATGLAQRLSSGRRTKDTPLVLISSVASRTLIEGTPFGDLLTRPLKQSSVHDVLMSRLTHRSRHVSRHTAGQLDTTMGQRQPLRILVAEDNATNQRLMLRLLERLGYAAELASDGVAVMEVVARTEFDVILMDVQMPRMHGLEAARMIRSRVGHQPWIAAVTANATTEDQQAAAEAGMQGYVTKPIRVEELTAALDQAWAWLHDGPAQVGRAATAPSASDHVAADPPAGAIDRAALRRLSELTGDESFTASLLAEFSAEMSRLLAAIRQTAGTDDDALRRHAHSLKSSAATVGAVDLSAAAARLEQLARARRTASLEVELTELDRLAEATRRGVAELTREGTG
ncbi:response regulator [Ornithinicoccus halotolerans]|uniref:response regulator n=1 Tax=Ornithinicoccus halotolerans TaxID=1748220 RepID=UPI001297CF01|nr:response regulator [Ornithinicoccus halotolerans]